MFCHLGPPIWMIDQIPDDESGGVSEFARWDWPAGTLSVIDLRPIADCGLAGKYGDHPWAFVVAESLLKDDGYSLLGEGDPRDVRIDDAMRDAWFKTTGVVVEGDTLADLLRWHLTTGADPMDLDACKPLMPTVQRQLELHCGDMQLSEKFVFGVHPLTNKIQTLLKAEFASLFQSAQRGELKDAEHHRRVLDSWCDKYRLRGADDWKALVPADLQSEVPGPLKHETTITESFNTSNSSTLGPNLSWTELIGDMEVSGNQCRQVVAATASQSRADSDLSGTDHYCQVSVVTRGNATGPSTNAVCRKDGTGTNTCYLAGVVDSGSGDSVFFSKFVAGVLTNLGNGAVTVALPQIVRITANGSTITATWDGATVGTPATDTSITTGLRCGVRMGGGVTVRRVVDSFEASDLAGGGHPTIKRFGGVRFAANLNPIGSSGVRIF